MGESTDAYKGCPGLCPKSAEAILQKAGDPWENVLQAYRSAFAKDKEPSKSKWLDRTPEDLALLNARLARILRVGDCDSKARRPILWEPPDRKSVVKGKCVPVRADLGGSRLITQTNDQRSRFSRAATSSLQSSYSDSHHSSTISHHFY